MKIQKTAMLSVFLALALILSYVESLIPFFIGVPGMKLGLPNAAILLLLYLYGAGEAALLNMLRILAAGFLFGNVFSIVYSLAGGILSFFVMFLLKKTGRFHVVTISVCGGISHNLGQNIMAAFIAGNGYLFYYFPVLLLAGAVTGALIGVLAASLLPRLRPLFKQER